MTTPEAKSAARPYPVQYVWAWTARDGTPLTIRPIHPGDEPLLVRFHATLSDRTVYLRYFCSMSLAARTAHERLVRICFGDYAREIVLVAERHDGKTQERSILAVGRLNKLENRDAEAALLVADHYQRLGLGSELLRRLIGVAREEHVQRIVSEMLRDNLAVQSLFKKCGFCLQWVPDDPTTVQAVLELPDLPVPDLPAPNPRV